MARRWIAAGCLATLGVLMIAADGAVAAASRRGLELAGIAERQVRFVAGEGRAVLSARNVSRRPGRLELVFVGRGGDRQAVLGSRRDRDPQPVSVLDPQDLSRPLAGGVSRRIDLRLRLAADQARRIGAAGSRAASPRAADRRRRWQSAAALPTSPSIRRA